MKKYSYNLNIYFECLDLINNDNFEISGELFSIDGKKRYFKTIKDISSNFLKASTELGNYLKSEAKDNYKK